MDAETRARRDACQTFVHADGPVRPAELLARISPDVEADIYGEGGVVAELEEHVATLLGRPAAVFLPSGTMAQGAVLRVHAETRSSSTVLWHPRGPRHARGPRGRGRAVRSAAARAAAA